MAGPDLARGALMPGGLQRTASTQILSIRSFIASFGVAHTKRSRLRLLFAFYWFVAEMFWKTDVFDIFVE
jgi:hypothetical protein